MPWSALVGGLIAGVASGAMSYASARQQQQATVDAYKHRHQWQVADLRAAGLNPILSATQGAGSVGSMAAMETPDIAGNVSKFSAAQLQKEQVLTEKSTQAQQLANAAQLTASAEQAQAEAEVAKLVAAEYRADPVLARQKALTDAGLAAASPTGTAWRFLKEVDSGAKYAYSSAKEIGGKAIDKLKSINFNSAKSHVFDGGSITAERLKRHQRANTGRYYRKK